VGGGAGGVGGGGGGGCGDKHILIFVDGGAARRAEGQGPYMLNTCSAEKNTVFYSYLACFMNTVILNMEVSMSYTGFNQAEYGTRIRVVVSQKYVNMYSTCMPKTPSSPNSSTIPTVAYRVNHNSATALEKVPVLDSRQREEYSQAGDTDRRPTKTASCGRNTAGRTNTSASRYNQN